VGARRLGPGRVRRGHSRGVAAVRRIRGAVRRIRGVASRIRGVASRISERKRLSAEGVGDQIPPSQAEVAGADCALVMGYRDLQVVAEYS
jgi:hypothetical protein